MERFMPITQQIFDTLPEAIKEDIKQTFSCFNEVNVIFENGKYRTSVGYGIYSHYPEDYKFIGVAYIEDFYSIEERRANYKETFGYAPGWNPAWVEAQKAKEVGKVFIK